MYGMILFRTPENFFPRFFRQLVDRVAPRGETSYMTQTEAPTTATARDWMIAIWTAECTAELEQVAGLDQLSTYQKPVPMGPSQGHFHPRPAHTFILARCGPPGGRAERTGPPAEGGRHVH